MKTSETPFVSGARLVASDRKTTKRPSALSAGLALAPLPWAPPVERLMRAVTPLPRLRTKMSATPLVSPETRFDAEDENAIHLPFALRDDSALAPFASPPDGVRLTRWVSPLPRRKTKTSPTPLV